MTQSQEPEDEDLPRLSRREYVIGEVEFLRGYTWPNDLATKLGYKDADSLNAALCHWDRPDLAQYFEKSRYDGLVKASILTGMTTRKKKQPA